MTNEERSALIAQGWTPPVGVDPDLAEAEDLHEAYIDNKYSPAEKAFYHAIKRGRELERAEAQPGMVWVKHDGSEIRPVSVDQYVWVRSFGYPPYARKARNIAWQGCSHYAIIPQPEEK